MAKLHGDPILLGSIENFTGYYDDGMAIIRMKSPLDKKRWKKDPKFTNTRRAATEFGGAVQAAKWIWRSLPPKMRQLGWVKAFNQIVGALRECTHIGTATPHPWISAEVVAEALQELDLSPESCKDWTIDTLPADWRPRIRWRFHVCAVELQDYAYSPPRGRYMEVTGTRAVQAIRTGEWHRISETVPVVDADLVAAALAELPKDRPCALFTGFEVVLEAPARDPHKRGRPQVDKVLHAACSLKLQTLVPRTARVAQKGPRHRPAHRMHANASLVRAWRFPRFQRYKQPLPSRACSAMASLLADRSPP